MLIRKNEPLRGPLREHEESRLRDFFSLLEFVRRRRYEPTTTEWLLIQDCLDDVFRRSSDTWFILFAAMAWPLRGRGRRSLTKLLPLYAGFVGWELGLRDRNTMPATDFFSSIIRVDSELGEAARRIYSPLVFGETMALHDRVASGFLPAVAEVLRSMTLENLFRETFAGSLIGVISVLLYLIGRKPLMARTSCQLDLSNRCRVLRRRKLAKF